jgi:predicted small lipoprotein YifL
VGLTGFFGRRWRRVAAIGALVAALGLAACGRKSGLELPPAAAVPAAQPLDQPAQVQGSPPPGLPQQSLLGGTAISEPSAGGRGSGSRAVAAPPSGKREPFFLDWLLN